MKLKNSKCDKSQTQTQKFKHDKSEIATKLKSQIKHKTEKL